MIRCNLPYAKVAILVALIGAGASICGSAQLSDGERRPHSANPAPIWSAVSTQRPASADSARSEISAEAVARSASPSNDRLFPLRSYAGFWNEASPTRLTVHQQKALGAAVIPHVYMDSLWSQGIAGNHISEQIPIYVAVSTDPLLTTTCSMYGGHCSASNIRIHVPPYAIAQAASDGHVTIIDQAAPSGAIEIDCWQATFSNRSLSCSWAGAFALGGPGNDTGGEGVHFGRPVSSYFITGQEILDGNIAHALGINAICLNDPSIYPAQTFAGTDTACRGGGSNPPHYGNLIHLLWSESKIANSPYSAPCKTILAALVTYGAYLDDTGDDGLELRVENDLSYTLDPALKTRNPWPLIQSQLNAAGDASGTTWHSCFNRLASSDFEMLQVAEPRDAAGSRPR
jgi:hypothetical protein